MYDDFQNGTTNTSFLTTIAPANVSYFSDSTNTSFLTTIAPANVSYFSDSAIIGLVVECLIMEFMAVVGMVGNGLLLTVFRATANLQTKTDRILASLTVSDLLTAVMTSISAATLPTRASPDSLCRYFWLYNTITAVGRIQPMVTSYHMILIAVDRYLAICRPLQYENIMTETTISRLIVAAWLSGTATGGSYFFWLINWKTAGCGDVVDGRYYFLDSCMTCTVSLILTATYSRVTYIAWQHHIRIKTISPTAAATSVAVSTTAQAGHSMTSSPANNAVRFKVTSQSRSGVAQVQSTANDDVIKTVDDPKHAKRQFKALHLTAAVVGIYVLLETPYAICNGLLAAGSQSLTVVTAYQICSGIAMIYFAFNWTIYGLVSSKFRQGMIDILRRVFLR